jgi:adenosylcobinamide kinase/adenosylcobinamide-phosphate guanylyltransferase
MEDFIAFMSAEIMSKITLILGGARSGKSYFAQELAKKGNRKVLFVATAEPLDDEMRVRIEEHRKNRPVKWKTLEVTKNLGMKIKECTKGDEIIIIDCITLLISNLLYDEPNYPVAEKRVLKEINALLECINTLDAHFIIVSNEVGLGLVPDNKLGRIYRDMLGKSNQLLASQSGIVYFMVAGIPSRILSDTGNVSH